MHKNKKSNPIPMSVLFLTEINVVSVICCHLTKVFPAHLAEPHCSTDTCLLHKSAVQVSQLTFHVPAEIFSLPLIYLIFGTPVEYLSPTSPGLTAGAVIVVSGCYRSAVKVLLVFIIMVIDHGQRYIWVIKI